MMTFIIETILTAAIILYALALFSYHPGDPSYFSYTDTVFFVHNCLGKWGAYGISFFIYYFGGIGSYFFGFFCIYLLYLFIINRSVKEEIDRLIAWIIFIPATVIIVAWNGIDLSLIQQPGGSIGYHACLFGRGLHHFLLYIWGIYALAMAAFIIMTRLFFYKYIHFFCEKIKQPFYKPVMTFVINAKNFAYSLYYFLKEQKLSWQYGSYHTPQYAMKCEEKDCFEENFQEAKVLQRSELENVSENAPEKKVLYTTPTVPVVKKKSGENRKNLEEHQSRAKIIEDKLSHFGISGKIVSIKSGPVVTVFEYQPNIDTKLSKIITLEDDLALALSAMSVRIIAPIPGTSVVGFEVANVKREDVHITSLLSLQNYKKKLPLVFGVDTIGDSCIVDLANMPHLLIAGSTGSGKSVALNGMLATLLCKKSPDDLRLILIDPKRLEFAAYADIPHLIFPIITQPRQAIIALQWLAKTMEERYDAMAEVGVKNIVDYQEKALQKNGMVQFPYIVAIIDELADLMMVAGKEIEFLITRIVQMARAAGIHLIVATQRPSVDVITGLIKVNFPNRVSFRVTSRADSRTILDAIGAERLLGRGDMLFLDAEKSQIRRIHGAYITDSEIRDLVAQIKAQRKAQYLDLNDVISAVKQSDNEDDHLYGEVLQFVKESKEVSISLLQRKFRIGYNRSARLIEKLEMQGLILPPDGSKTRKVVR